MSMVNARDNVYSGVVMTCQYHDAHVAAIYAPYRLTRTTAGDLNTNEIVLMIAKEENHMVDFNEEVVRGLWRRRTR